MSSTTFLILLVCAVPLVTSRSPVKESWTLTEQCELLNYDAVGECIPPEGDETDICNALRCAVPNKSGTGFKEVLLEPPRDGTICGTRRLCKNGECRRARVRKMPVETGLVNRVVCSRTEWY